MGQPLITFPLHHFMQVTLIAERFPFRLLCRLLIALPDCGQVQMFQVLRQFRLNAGQFAHCHTSLPPWLNNESKLASDTSAI